MKSTIMLLDRHTREYTPIEITAYKTDRPGLIVHRRACLDFDNEVCYINKSWRISHSISGITMCPKKGFEKKADALMAVKRYPDIDWTQEPEVLAKIDGIHRQIMNACKDEV